MSICWVIPERIRPPQLTIKTKLAKFEWDYRIPAHYLESVNFHHIEKGCDTRYFGIRKCPYLIKWHKKCESCEAFPRTKCNTHNLIVCHCGIEFGWHTLVWTEKYRNKELIIEDE